MLFLEKNQRPEMPEPLRFFELEMPRAISSASASVKERELFSGGCLRLLPVLWPAELEEEEEEVVVCVVEEVVRGERLLPPRMLTVGRWVRLKLLWRL